MSISADLGRLNRGSGTGGFSAISSSSSTQKGWRPEKIGRSFDLTKAEDMAYAKASGYMNKMLMLDEMEVSIKTKEQELDVNGSPSRQGVIKDRISGEVMNVYEGVQVLKLYSKNYKANGVIVDGVV